VEPILLASLTQAQLVSEDTAPDLGVDLHVVMHSCLPRSKPRAALRRASGSGALHFSIGTRCTFRSAFTDRAPSWVSAVAEVSGTEAVVDLNAYRLRFDGQDWVAWRLCNEVRISCEVPGDWTGDQVIARAEELFGELGYLGTELSGSGKT